MAWRWKLRGILAFATSLASARLALSLAGEDPRKDSLFTVARS
jgi:hypothetical protein